MTTYLVLKYWHILSAFLLFGTGLGSAFYKWMADRSGNIQHIAVTNKHVVLADWLFTSPAIIMQPLTGLWMISITQLPITTPWVFASLVLYIFAGLCWLPVVYLQIKMKRISEQAALTNEALPLRYWQYARIWFWLGVPAFIAIIFVIFLMVFKHL